MAREEARKTKKKAIGKVDKLEESVKKIADTKAKEAADNAAREMEEVARRNFRDALQISRAARETVDSMIPKFTELVLEAFRKALTETSPPGVAEKAGKDVEDILRRKL